MNWFLNLQTRTKLFLGFGLIIALLAAITLTAYQGLSAVTASQKILFERDFALATDLLKLGADLNLQRASMLEMMNTTNQADQSALERGVNQRADEIDQNLAGLGERLKNDAKVFSQLEELRKTREAWGQTRDTQVFPLIHEGKFAEVKNLLLGVQHDRFEKIHSLATNLVNEAGQRAGAAVAQSQQRAEDSTRSILILGVIAFIVGVGMTLFLSAIIAKPLTDISSVADRIAAGDLTVKVSSNGRLDEVGALTRTFRTMVDNLRRTTADLSEGVNVLSSSASEIVASTSQLSSSATESATAVSETTTTVEEVRQTAQVATQKAKAVSDSAQKAATISQTGRKSTDDVTAGMSRIRQQMEAIAVSMVRLSEQSQTIGQIIATVEDLAAQSNLLAVNAAIEAAKAGEHGKGFSVVAQEVKSLAEQSRQATTQVRTILSDIQKATTAAVMATEQGSKAVEAGEKQTGAAGESIQVLAGSVTESAQAATQIAASSQQQLVGMDQVATAMENIKQASTQNVASAKQLETAARNLNELGQRLKQMVERYKV
jgi:methyl-accepting chemotaxis protein